MRIPHSEDFTLFNGIAVALCKNRTNYNLVSFNFAVVFVKNQDGASLIKNDIRTIGCLYDTQPLINDLTTCADLDLRILKNTRRNTANVECAHGQLCARLADRLSGDNTNRRTTFNHGRIGWIDAVFECGDTDLLTCGEC